MNPKILYIAFLSLFVSGCACHCRIPLTECPSTTRHEQVVYHKGYTLCFNPNTHASDWVAYELTQEETLGEWPRSDDFRHDPDIQEQQASHSDYRGTGWHRGHLAPAGDMKWDSVAMSESFFYTNICPQSHALNQGPWQRLENKVRLWAKQYGSVYVCCGPIYTTNHNGTLGQTQVMVPDQYYKALLIHNDSVCSAIAFIMDNGTEKQSLEQCACTVDELEQVIGRDLFCPLEKSIEETVESTINWDDWGMKKEL